MFGAATPFNAQTLATMMGMNSNNFQLPAPVPQFPKSFSPEMNIFSLLQEASKMPPFLTSLQDLILQSTFLNLLQAQVNAKVTSPPLSTQPSQQPQQLLHTPNSLPSRSPSDVVAVSRKRPSSSSSRKTSDDPDVPQPKRTKQMRKLASEDAETNSPVSGMHIKDMSEISADDIAKAAELDETASFVIVSEETRRKLAEIPDVIKSTNCALCKVKFEDVIHLARHKCPRIVHEEYKCSECEKVFSCPANLASHKRWHGPRPLKVSSSPQSSSTRESSSPENSKIDIFSVPAIQLFSENFLSPKIEIKKEEEEEVKVEIE